MVVILVETIVKEKTDSISLSRTSTGKYSWDIKIYSENLMVASEQDSVIAQIGSIHNKLQSRFSPEQGEI